MLSWLTADFGLLGPLVKRNAGNLWCFACWSSVDTASSLVGLDASSPFANVKTRRYSTIEHVALALRARMDAEQQMIMSRPCTGLVLWPSIFQHHLSEETLHSPPSAEHHLRHWPYGARSSARRHQTLRTCLHHVPTLDGSFDRIKVCQVAFDCESIQLSGSRIHQLKIMSHFMMVDQIAGFNLLAYRWVIAKKIHWCSNKVSASRRASSSAEISSSRFEAQKTFVLKSELRAEKSMQQHCWSRWGLYDFLGIVLYRRNS